MPFRSRHVLTAAALHVLLFVFLLVGARCTPKLTPPPVIEALVITGKNQVGKLKTEPPKQTPPVEEPKPEPPPPEPPKPEPPKPEPPKPDPMVEKKKLEQEKIKREMEIKREAEIQLKKEEQEKKKKEEEEEKKRLAEEKRKADEERKRKEEEARHLKEMMEQSLSEETEARAEAARIGEIQKTWGQILGEYIGDHWLRPPGLPTGLSCKAQIDILPNGEVVAVKIIQSSGNLAFDASVENAIYKSSPLPLPSDPKAFKRTLTPNFTPESLSRH